MSDYTQTVDFSAKDSLSTGDSNKLIVGLELDNELDALDTAITSKFDSNDLATQAQAEALTSDTVLITPHSLNDVLAENASMLQDIQALTDPGSDRILGWDESANAVIAFTLTAPLQGATTAIEIAAASLTAVGVTETATQAEVDTGTDALRYVAPATLRGAIGMKESKSNVADQAVTSSETLVDVTGLTGLVIDSGSNYRYRFSCEYTQNAGDIKIGFTYDQTPADAGYIGFKAIDSAATVEQDHSSTGITHEFSVTALGNNLDSSYISEGYFASHASTAGTLKVQFAQAASSANDTTIKRGAILEVWKVGAST